MPFDALIVLGCRIRGGQLSGAALRRVERAARAYREQGATLVVASGGKLWEGVSEASAFERGLIAGGVPREQIVQELTSLTTRGNARGVACVLSQRGAKRLGLVTCDWHMPRALRLFRAQGLHAVAVPAASPARSLTVTSLRWLRERGSLALDLLLSPGWMRS